MWEFTIWILAIVLVAFFIFSVVFTMISCSDLENNYIGPIEMVHRINQIVYFEYGLHAVLTAVYLVTFNFLEFALNLPFVIYNGWLVLRQKHLLDETRILQDDNLAQLRKRELIKLLFFLVCFFLYLYKFYHSLELFSGRPGSSGEEDY